MRTIGIKKIKIILISVRKNAEEDKNKEGESQKLPTAVQHSV
jgi:hypothetical protein